MAPKVKDASKQPAKKTAAPAGLPAFLSGASCRSRYAPKPTLAKLLACYRLCMPALMEEQPQRGNVHASSPAAGERFGSQPSSFFVFLALVRGGEHCAGLVLDEPRRIAGLYLQYYL